LKQKQSFYLKAKKSLGQNFIKDHSVIENITLAVSEFLNEKDITIANLLEIGPGTGTLSRALLTTQEFSLNHLTAVEKDHRAIKGLEDSLVSEFSEKFTLDDADILKYSPKQYDLCLGNIPYYITSDILMWLCKNKQQFLGAIFMVQDEVADRLCAQVNTKEYSRLTVKMQLNFNIKKLFQVSNECFVPRPKVNSAVVLFLPREFSFTNAIEEKKFESFTTLFFSQRRKMLRRILSDAFKGLKQEEIEGFWTEAKPLNILETNRPESIDPQKFLLFFRMYQHLLSLSN